MKFCTVIVILKAYQNTKEIFKSMTFDVTMESLLKQWEIRTSAKPDKLYIIRKLIMRAFRKCIFFY